MKFSRIIYLLLVLLIVSVVALVKWGSNLEQELDTSKANEKALIFNNDSLKQRQRVLELTNEQLSYFNDSVITKYKEIEKKLKIKNTQSIQYIKEEYYHTDTLILRDTIFKKDVHLDTLMGDKWCNINLTLDYPGTISVSPSFKSEKYIIVHAHKEYVDPPKKFFLLRWFQKKHTVVEVDVVEENPYVDLKENRYIKIIK